jgi:hypothetical protein
LQQKHHQEYVAKESGTETLCEAFSYAFCWVIRSEFLGSLYGYGMVIFQAAEILKHPLLQPHVVQIKQVSQTVCPSPNHTSRVLLGDQQEVHDHHQHSFPLSSDGETSDAGRKSRCEGELEFENGHGQMPKQSNDEYTPGSEGYEDGSEWVYERSEREAGHTRGVVKKYGYDLNEKDKMMNAYGVHRQDSDLGRGARNVARNTRMRIQKDGGAGHQTIPKKDSPLPHVSSPINPIIGSTKPRNEKDDRALRPHAMVAKHLQAPKQVKNPVSKRATISISKSSDASILFFQEQNPLLYLHDELCLWLFCFLFLLLLSIIQEPFFYFLFSSSMFRLQA